MGSDGGSCASCHFGAGTDNRLTGQMNPAFRAGAGADTHFGCNAGTDCINGNETGSGGTASGDYSFVEADYPFRQFAIDPATGTMIVNDRNAPLRLNTNDIHSSSGSFDAEFKKAFYGKEFCGKPSTELFYKDGVKKWHGYKLAKRAVEPRNTAITVNSGMSFPLAWDIKFTLPAVGIEGYEYSHPELCIPNEGNLFAPGMGHKVGDPDRPETTKDLLGILGKRYIRLHTNH